MRPFIIYTFLIVVISATRHSKYRTGIITAGDVVIGGLVPVHFSPNFAPHPENSSCRGHFHLRGLKGVEAMLYAVELINNDTALLPNLTLGVDIKDTCGSVDYAIMESLSFDFIRGAYSTSESLDCSETSSGDKKISRKTKLKNGPDLRSGSLSTTSREDSNVSDCCSSKSRTAAIIGAAFSGVTMATASLTGLFHVPVISYASTSRLLSDRSRFLYFFRTVPSDNLQAQAVTHLLVALKWHLVVVLASDNEYGRSGITALKQIIQSHTKQQICVVVDELFSRKGSKEQMTTIFQKIKQFSQARVIILYAEFPDAVYFFSEAQKASLANYMFIASDSWVGSTEVTQGADDVFHSIIGLRPPIISLPTFDSYFMESLLKNNSVNPWVHESKRSLNCDEGNASQCYSGVHHDGYVPYVIDAVFSVAHALHAMLNCSTSACSKKWSDVDIRDLSKFIQNVSFPGYSRQHFFFSEEGSTRGLYDIYRLNKGSLSYAKVGSWSETPLNLSEISAHGISFEFPASICSNDCKKGEYKIPKSQFPECCWSCAKCSGKSFANTSHVTQCSDCPTGTWPTADHSGCSPIEARYLHWSESWAIAIVFLSSFGFALVVCTGIIFIKFRGTAIVRAASRQLCYFLLLGIAMFYVTPLPYIAKPSAASCKLLPFMFGFCFVLVVGSILIRTNRVSRIFNEKLLRTGKINCLDNHWQLLILGSLLTTELALSVVWVFGSSTPVLPQVIYSQNSEDASLICNLAGSQIGFSLWLIYNAGLVVVCTYQAFLVRKVPQNYNESRLIAFNMTTICITVLVYIPSYMGTSAWYRTVISSFMFIFLGTLTWASIFAPKIYIILFRPHKNIPMRPSVSSITLGVITPSPASTQLGNLSEQSMHNQQNSITPNEDESWEGLWANFDSSRDENGNEAPNEEEDSQMSQAQFLGELDVFPEPGHEENTEIETKTDTAPELDENCAKIPQKKTSVVRFEDEVTTEKTEDKENQVISRKKSNSNQGGILRRTCTSENFENLCNGVNPKKKKTSLVRFQDEVANYEFKHSDKVSLAASREEPYQLSGFDERKLNERTDRLFEGQEQCTFVKSPPVKLQSNGVTEQERKRKISVFSFQ